VLYFCFAVLTKSARTLKASQNGDPFLKFCKSAIAYKHICRPPAR
jgi:hypothetical protein